MHFRAHLPRLAGFAAASVVFAVVAVWAKPPEGFPPLEQMTPAALGPHEPELDLPFPGPALTRSIPRGTARVAVLVDADGKPVDFLVTAASDPSFGDALLVDLKRRSFQAEKLNGVAVPGRADIAYSFEAPSSGMVATDAAANLSRLGREAAGLSAQPEDKLDRDLEFTAASLPLLPPQFAALAKSGKVRAYVTFFVDPQGHVRIPQVESTPAPELVADAIRVVQKWTFKAPTIKGKPALVYAGRPVRFLTEADARAMSK